jgi:hypothetical protein
MNTHRLRQMIGELHDFREKVREFGDERELGDLDALIERVRELADRADEILSRFGDPPTDE